MKKLLTSFAAFTALTAAASAADLPRRAAPPVFVPVPVFTWTGFYLGFNAGYGFDAGNRQNAFALPAGSVVGSPGTNGVLTLNGGNNRDMEGFVGGGQIGYNYQFTPGNGLVVGIEADAQYTDFGNRRGNSTYTFVGTTGLAFAPPAATVVPSRNSLDYFGTVRGRVGYAFDRVLFYGTGGFAYGSGNNDVAGLGGNGGDFRTGYAAGGGVEYALPTDSFLNFFKSSAVTLKVEGLYVNLERNRTAATGVYNQATNTLFLGEAGRSQEFAVIRAGLNYKFGTY
jgi:outer membrane immunogenic protein